MKLLDRLSLALRQAHRRRIERRAARRQAEAYTRWVTQYDGSAADLPPPESAAGITLLLPAVAAEARAVRDAVAGLQAQRLATWTLVALVRPADAAALADLVAQEPRLRLLAGDVDMALWASAVQGCSTPWLANVGPGDRWSPQALQLLAEAALQQPEARVVYGDHDRIDARGRRHDPHFKPDWNPELLLAMNWLEPLALFRSDDARRALAAGLGALPDLDALRHGLALACTESLQAGQVVHVPHILAHAARPARASVDAVRWHLAPLGAAVQVRAGPADTCELSFAPPQPLPRVTAIVPTRDRLELLAPCIEGLLQRTAYANLDVIVVDNGSTDPATLDWLRRQSADPRVQVLRDDGPFNYSALNNAAVEQARGDYVLLLNNDTEVVDPGWLAEMVGLAARPGIGAVGARLWFDDFTLQHFGLVLGMGGVAGYPHRRLTLRNPGYHGRGAALQAVSAVTAACLLVRRELYRAVGGLDAQHLAVAYNDVDFCLKLQAAGFRNVVTPRAALLHHESRSRGSDADGARRARFEREFETMRQRWGALLDRDPLHNPNLALDGNGFEPAFPPRVPPAPAQKR